MDTQEAEEIERDGMAYIVRVHLDHDTNPNEYDCYDAEDIAAYERGEWWFVGVEVYATVAPDTSASLWALNMGTAPGWETTYDLAYYLTQSEGTVTDMTTGVTEDSGSVVDNLVMEVNAMLTQLRDALTAAPLPA